MMDGKRGLGQKNPRKMSNGLRWKIMGKLGGDPLPFSIANTTDFFPPLHSPVAS